MKPTTTRAEKALPRARIAYLVSCEMFYPFKPKGEKSTVHVIVDCPTRAQAARIARVANMTEGERVEMVARLICDTMKWPSSSQDSCERLARAVLSSLGLATGGKA